MVERINTGQGLPSQIAGTQSKSGEEAFHDMAKSDGYNKGELDKAIAEKTRLTRTKGADRTKKQGSLFLVSDNNEELSEEPVYRTVMVDGMLFTLRLLAVA